MTERKPLESNVLALLGYFDSRREPEHLKAILQPFEMLARQTVAALPPGPETTTCLRKLLEARDCAVRALLPVYQ